MTGSRLLTSLILVTALCGSTAVLAGEYYRWVDAEGVTHYGSTPPAGVQAEKVKTYGAGPSSPSTASTPSPAASAAPANAADIEAQQKQMAAQRNQECKAEQERVATLKRSRGRVRMQLEDGSSKYLSLDEIQQEIAQSEDFLRNVCGG